MLGNIKGLLFSWIFQQPRPRKLKYVHATIPCLDGHPQKFIFEMTKPQKICILKISQYTVDANGI